MELRNEIIIDAPAERVWHVLAERFMYMGEWAAPVSSSCAIGPREPIVGAVRACSHAAVGPIKGGEVKERLTKFDPPTLTFEYEAVDGLPAFVRRAVNEWSIQRLDPERCVVRVRATVTLRGIAAFLSLPIRWQLRAVGDRVTQELKHFVETGRAHPRKLAASARSGARVPD